jgi:hypothetical protein
MLLRSLRFGFALLGAVLLGASSLLAAGAPPKEGPDFLVNATTQGSQTAPDVARYPAGNFVVVWRDDGDVFPDGALQPTLRGRFFKASGAPASGEIVLAALDQNFSQPRVAALPDGGFAVAWEGLFDVFLRRFDGAGRPLGDAVVVNTSIAEPSHNPDVAADPAGNLFVVWSQDGFFEDTVWLRRFDAAGNSQGNPIQVNQTGGGLARRPRVAVNGSGSLLVSWDDDKGLDVVARRFDGASGSWAPEVRLEAPFGAAQMRSAPVLYPEGDGAVVFGDFGNVGLAVYAQRLDAAGKLLGPVVAVGDDFMEFGGLDATADAHGNALAVWSRFEGKDRQSTRIYGRLFDRSWHPLSDAFPVSPSSPVYDLGPSVASAGEGFVAVWANGDRTDLSFPIFPIPTPIRPGRDGSRLGVFGQVFGPLECAAGSEVLCLGEGDRFRVTVSWKIPGTGQTGAGHSLPLTADTGAFWFFGPDNLELLLKVLDGRTVNGHFWVYSGALSNVEYTITVTDTATGRKAVYHNPGGQFASLADVMAFADAGKALPAAAPSPLPGTEPLEPSQKVGCAAAAESLCLTQGRFQVQVDFTDPRNGATGHGQAVPLTADTGAFWFFGSENLELMIKVLDGRAVNGRFWVFYGALSDVAYTLTVTDTETGQKRTYQNDRGRLASRADVEAFPGN